MREMNSETRAIRPLLTRNTHAANDTAAPTKASLVMKSVMLNANYTISAPLRCRKLLRSSRFALSQPDAFGAGASPAPSLAIALRHGISTSTLKNRIVSSPSSGTSRHSASERSALPSVFTRGINELPEPSSV